MKSTQDRELLVSSWQNTSVRWLLLPRNQRPFTGGWGWITWVCWFPVWPAHHCLKELADTPDYRTVTVLQWQRRLSWFTMQSSPARRRRIKIRNDSRGVTIPHWEGRTIGVWRGNLNRSWDRAPLTWRMASLAPGSWTLTSRRGASELSWRDWMRTSRSVFYWDIFSYSFVKFSFLFVIWKLWFRCEDLAVKVRRDAALHKKQVIGFEL